MEGRTDLTADFDEPAPIFYLGTHQPGWLGRTDVPLFLSRRRLEGVKTLRRATGPWALDSGGFSELSLFGKWTVSPEKYADEVRRWRDGIGHLKWAAIQDWMCEPHIRANTGLTLARHQHLTCLSWARLREIAPELPWVPVIQGQALEDYMMHVALYERWGLDLKAAPTVGVGSICRRQATAEAKEILTRVVRALAPTPVHAFGVKQAGLVALALAKVPLGSADSLAWSFKARREQAPGTPECLAEGKHKNCANCLRYALRYRERLLTKVKEASCKN